MYQQMLGRVTRTYNGERYPEKVPEGYPKPYGLVLDLVDNAAMNSAVNINDLFGLPNRYSPKEKSESLEKEMPGEDLGEFINRVEEEVEKETLVYNLTQKVDVDQVIVNIFKKLPPAVARDSKVQWYPDSSGGFYTTVSIDKKKTALVGLKQNLLGQWLLTWNGLPAKKNGPWITLREAMADTRKILNKQFSKSKSLWSKNAIIHGWGSKPASDKQIQYLRLIRKKGKLPLGIRLECLTRGEAAHLITMSKYKKEKD